jgi:hypothetical protein
MKRKHFAEFSIHQHTLKTKSRKRKASFSEANSSWEPFFPSKRRHFIQQLQNDLHTHSKKSENQINTSTHRFIKKKKKIKITLVDSSSKLNTTNTNTNTNTNNTNNTNNNKILTNNNNNANNKTYNSNESTQSATKEKAMRRGYYFDAELNRYFKIPKPGTPFYNAYINAISNNKLSDSNIVSMQSNVETHSISSRERPLFSSASNNFFHTVLKRERELTSHNIINRWTREFSMKKLTQYNTFPTQTSGTECNDLQLNPSASLLVAGMKNGVITYIQNNTKRKRERKTINNR